jgi:hypothetical protein
MMEEEVDKLGHWRAIIIVAAIVESMELKLPRIATIRRQVLMCRPQLHAPAGPFACARTP